MATLVFNSKLDPDYDYNNNNQWDINEVWAKLIDTALDLGDEGRDYEYGWGLVNAWYSNQRPTADIAGSTTDPTVPPDGRVNYKDLYVLLHAYGSYPGHPNWDIRADITIDNHVNYKDQYILLANYGKIDP